MQRNHYKSKYSEKLNNGEYFIFAMATCQEIQFLLNMRKTRLILKRFNIFFFKYFPRIFEKKKLFCFKLFTTFCVRIFKRIKLLRHLSVLRLTQLDTLILSSNCLDFVLQLPGFCPPTAWIVSSNYLDFVLQRP